MALDLRNTFGQLQSSSSEDEQVESVPSSSAHSTIEVEEGREVRDVEIDIDEDEEADPQAFLPSTAMTSLEVQEPPTEHSSTGSEADITIASSYDGDDEEQLTERIPALPLYTWPPRDQEWDADVNDNYWDTNFFAAEVHPELQRWQTVPAPFSLDFNHPSVQYGDTRCIGQQTTYYPPASNRDHLPWTDLIQAVLHHKDVFDRNNTIYLIVDNRQPTNVPHWPPFCAWWTSRRELKGPAEEATDIVWITATDQLDTIPYYWTGPLLLSIARWMFPSCHIALIDNDCVPLALFEMQDLLKLSQQLPEWRSLLEDAPELPPQIGMILVTEPHFEHNAGLVISPASERMAPDLTLPVEQLNDHFQACLADFLSSSKPPTDPTEAATSGLLHTPLLGVPCSDTLHHCLAWATLGIYMIHTMWPPPRRHPGQKWPARSCSLSLTPKAQERNPPITMWARATFEQGCLAVLPSMEGPSRVVTLPGDQLFQAAHLSHPTQDMRAPILHAYGPNKETAPLTLELLAVEGWETLLPTLYGTQDKKPQWHLGTWTPVGGMAVQSNVTPTPISQDLRASLSLLWHRTKRQGPLPSWTVETFAKPLLPHETTLTYNKSNPTQVSPIEKTLLELQVRESSRYATTAIAVSREHQSPCVEQLFNAQLLPQVVLQKPMPAEAEAILALPLRLRKLVMTKIMHRFANMGLNTSLLVDCPGLGGDSLDLSPPPDITICCLAVGNTQVYGPTLTPVDKVAPNGHIVSYGNTSGVHEMTIALLGIDQNAIRWEKLGLGTASDILHRTLLVLQQAQRLPAHRRPPHAFVLGACAIKLSLYHPYSQRHWLHIVHDAYVTPFTDSRHIRLRGFSAGSYTASVVALLLANQQTPWRIQLTIGAYAGPATVLTALCAKAATGQVTTNIVHLQADQLCLWGSTDISCFQIPPRFRICYITGQPRWMHAPFHSYAHLLEVQLPTGVHDAHQLVLELADLIPYKRRLGTPLRLITWMRMRTTNLEDSSRHIVNALRSPNPVQYLLQGYKVNTDDQAKAILFSQFDLTPCDTKDAIPPELCQWLKQLVQHHLQDLPLLELSTLISLFLPQIPRESLRTRNLHSLHPPPNTLALTRLHDGIGGMDQYQLTLTGWPPPLIFVPSSIDLTWREWLDESTNFKQIQFGVTIGDILCLCVEPHLFQDPDADPWGMGTIAPPLQPRSLVFAAIVTATQVKPSKSKPHHTEADKALLRANYRQIEFAIIPAPQGLVHFPPPHHLPHAQQPLEWADTAILKAIPACRLLYVSHRGTTWNCSHLVQLAETHKHHKPLTLGIPVQAPFTPAPSAHHEAIVTSLRNLVDILMLNRPSLCPALAPLAQHICETAATDSGHFVAVLSSVYLSLLTGRKALNIQGVFGAGKTRSVTLLMVWITFATEAKVIFLSKENPAGRAVEDLMASFGKLVPDLKSKLSRVMSAQESERHKNQQRPLVLDTKGSVPQTGNVGQALVATTGLVWSSKGNYRSRALQQTQEADIVIVEEAQQTPDVKTTLSLSHANLSSLLLLVGDEQQAPGGIEDDHDLKLLRGPLLNAPIGLRALPSEQYRSPHAIPRIIHQLLATLGPLDPAFTIQHLNNVCNPIAPLVLHSARTAPATIGRASSDQAPAAAHLTNLLLETLPLHLQDPQLAPPPIAVHSPTGTTIALLHLLGQADAGIHLHQATTAMEAAGLAGVHKWGIILPTSARVVKSIYEPAIATIYPSLCEVHDRQWKIGTPRQAIPTNLPTGPRFIRLHPNLYEKRPVSVEEIRQVFRLITQGMSQFKIGTTAQTGLLVMTNKTEVKAALDTRPPTATTQHIQIENVVTVAGATARHGLILQFNIGFLTPAVSLSASQCKAPSQRNCAAACSSTRNGNAGRQAN